MGNLPNAISIARAAAVIPVVALVAGGETAWAVAVFTVAALTDALDGPLARRLGAVSPTGAFLDPLADKVLMLGALLALGGAGRVDAWVLAIVIGRDVIVTVLRGAAAMRGLRLGPSAHSKVKTVLQGVAVSMLLLSMAVSGGALALLSMIALSAALALTITSGVDLVARAFDLLAPRPSERVRVHAR